MTLSLFIFIVQLPWFHPSLQHHRRLIASAVSLRMRCRTEREHRSNKNNKKKNTRQPPTNTSLLKFQHGGVDVTGQLLDRSVHMDDVVSEQQSLRAGRLGPASRRHPRATAARRSRGASDAAATCRRGARQLREVRRAKATRSGSGRHQLRGHDRQPAWEVWPGILRGNGRWFSSAEGRIFLRCQKMFIPSPDMTRSIK